MIVLKNIAVEISLSDQSVGASAPVVWLSLTSVTQELFITGPIDEKY